jgi:hypothetical protein
MTQPFNTLREAALALINNPNAKGITPKSASFIGQCCFNQMPLTDAQEAWFQTLLRKNDLPPFGGAQ